MAQPGDGTTRTPARRRPSPAALALVIAVGVVALQALLVPLFSAPAANLDPRDLPVVVAGPAPAAQGFAAQLESARPGAFEVTTLPDAASADEALRDRDAYAAFVVGPDGLTLHTAPAASPTVATLLTQASAQLNGGQPVRTVEVVPLDPDDPRGTGFASGFLPLAITSLLAGIGIYFAARGRGPRLAGLLGYAVLAGLTSAAVLQFWLGVIPGEYLLNAAAIGLFTLGVAGAVTGLAAVFGEPGVGLGALVIFLAGNALSGVAAAPQLLPQPWGEIGQWLPVGAGGTLLRSTAYFDGAGGATAAWILAAYAIVGLVLVALGRGRTAARTAPAAPEPAADQVRSTV
ncbi:ABC transporter permease [Phytohabitans sp. ZYX-F-186]|uniref:ABC transporter permease n=1 Tax=Phytohabitans maris TaxID=3071409 RepID=A0ABU0ZH87_9ACTN|nr:ABC transporter permease [Phytohabitans sp. ZYX-F-186]MDQ7906416.1 ABC transporter permease [Phytohabitans sp. ZYX-F-186]